jgi:hypothetical protein
MNTIDTVNIQPNQNNNIKQLSNKKNIDEPMTLNEMKLLIHLNVSNENMFRLINCLYGLDWLSLTELKNYVSLKTSILTKEIINYNDNLKDKSQSQKKAIIYLIENLNKCLKIEETIIHIISEFISGYRL